MQMQEHGLSPWKYSTDGKHAQLGNITLLSHEIAVLRACVSTIDQVLGKHRREGQHVQLAAHEALVLDMQHGQCPASV